MKNSNSKSSFARLFQAHMNWAAVLCRISFIIALALVSAHQARAGNELINPDMATGDFTGWTVYSAETWNYAIANTNGGTHSNPGTPNPDVAYPAGAQYGFWVYGDYQGSDQFDGMFQDVTTVTPGDVFSADGWAFSYANDYWYQNGQNQAWIEVSFRDATKTQILALYRSAQVWPAGGWVDLQVTNQFNPTTFAITNTTSTLVAPPGTADVRFQIVFNQINYGGGSSFWDDFNLNFISGPVPPTLSAISPSGITLCTNTALTCTATAAAGGTISSIQVITTTTTLGSTISTTVTNTYTTNSSVVTGLGTLTANLSFPLVANTIYTTVSITAIDNHGISASAAPKAFDTLAPALVIEASDFNFSSGGFIDTPANGGLALYTNQVGVQNIDENKNPANGAQANKGYYRPSDAVIVAGAYPSTKVEQKFVTAAANGDTTDVEQEVGYNGVGDWLDYSRTYSPSGSAPAGTYNVWLYMVTDGSGVQAALSQVTSDPTQSGQTTNFLGDFGSVSFSLTDSTWSAYEYVPLVDQFGNLVSVTLGAGKQTLRSTVVANPNLGFYMLMPVTPILTPALQFVYPDGAHPFEPTNHLSFTIGPANGSNITGSGISLVLNGVNVTANPGFSLTQVGSSWSVSYPIQSNTVYTAVINATNTAGLFSTFTINFDTFNPANFQWELVDYDFTANGVGGQFIDNPVPTGDITTPETGTLATNSYFGYPADLPGVSVAQQGVDINFNTTVGGLQDWYRADGVGDSPADDYLRSQFVAEQQALGDPNIGPFTIGWFVSGDWLNYTRHYPTNSFYVYARLAGGAGPFSGTSLSLVTSGYGTTNQTTKLLGTFSDPNAAGWAAWHWIPLLDTNGNKVEVPLGGQATLRVTSGNNLNAEFLMLVPGPLQFSVSAAIVAGQVDLSFPTQLGHTYTVLVTSSLTAPNWSPVGAAIVGDGTVHVVAETISGTQGYYTVQAH